MSHHVIAGLGRPLAESKPEIFSSNFHLQFTFAVERDWPLVPGPEDSLGVRREVRRELHREAGRGVDGAQAVVCRAGIAPCVLSARLTQT